MSYVWWMAFFWSLFAFIIIFINGQYLLAAALGGGFLLVITVAEIISRTPRE